MRSVRWSVGKVAVIVAAALMLVSTMVFAAPEIKETAFKNLWERQDLPVDQQLTDRSWTWGPTVSDLLIEDLKQAPNGERHVQYFEKSRMEINDPNADPNDQWYVTNGLLPIEMMTGKIQTGYNYPDDDYRRRGPARISVVGDPGNFPTYMDLLQIYESPGAVDPNDLNQPITQMLNPDGSATEFTDYTGDSNTVLVQGDNGHGIARAFANFMNQEGVVYQGGQLVRAQIYSPPVFVFGLPVTKPYWVNAKVGGNDMPILFQVFERRVLTYNPANPLAFRVEMGNVGLHYYQWRYQGGTPPTPEPTSEPTTEPEPTPEPTAEPEPTPTEEPYPYPNP